MRKNLALAKWRAGEPTIGGWLSLANTHTAELMANAGFDWLCVDLQHGLLGYEDLRHMLPAISTTDTTPLVRVAGNDPKEIMKVLDAGALGARAAFEAEAEGMLDYIRSTPPAEGIDRVRLPGDPERESLARRSADGIPIDDATWRQIQEAAASVGLNDPLLQAAS